LQLIVTKWDGDGSLWREIVHYGKKLEETNHCIEELKKIVRENLNLQIAIEKKLKDIDVAMTKENNMNNAVLVKKQEEVALLQKNW